MKNSICGQWPERLERIGFIGRDCLGTLELFEHDIEHIESQQCERARLKWCRSTTTQEQLNDEPRGYSRIATHAGEATAVHAQTRQVAGCQTLSAVMGYAAPAELAASLNAEGSGMLEDILSDAIHQDRSHRQNIKGGKVGGKQLNIGSFTVPVGLAIFFASVAVSLLSAWLVDRKRRDVEPVILGSLLIGLVVARVSFVTHYLPAYGGDFAKMLDVRDTGFTPLPGVIAGIASVILALVRRRNSRPPLVVGATLGLVTWFAASAAASAWQPAATVPDVALTNEGGGITALKFHDGKPLVVNLCAPCQDEMPALADMQRTNAGIDLVFVNQGESSSTVEAFINRLDLHIVNSVLDPSLEVAKATAVTAYPTTLFYDASGRLVDKHVGRFSRATFSAALDRLYPPTGTHAER